MQGWISLNRKIKNNWLWEDKPFSKGQAWIDLLLMVNHQKKKFLLGNQLVECDAGSTITSIRKLCDAWGWSNTKVKSFLEILVSDKMIIYKSDTKKTVINVVNYKVYQGKEGRKNDAETSPKRHESITNPSPKHTNNNVNNDNNDNKEKKKKKFDPYNDDYTKDYLEIYNTFPNTGGKRQGMVNYYKELDKHSHEKLLNCVKAYKKEVKEDGTEKDYMYKISNFFGEKSYYEDYLKSDDVKTLKVIEGKKVAYGKQEAFY